MNHPDMSVARESVIVVSEKVILTDDKQGNRTYQWRSRYFLDTLGGGEYLCETLGPVYGDGVQSVLNSEAECQSTT